MAIMTYSSRADRDKLLSANFTVGEFASKDGAATVLVDEKLVWYLQRIRDRFARPVTITSGYRSPAHNRAVGGATNSLHTKGQAADIYIEGVEPAEIARYAESLGCLGIGLYTVQRFVHIDTRTSKYYWVNDGREKAVSTHGGAAEEWNMTVENLEIEKDGRLVTVAAVNVDGSNYIKLRDVEKLAAVTVDYDAARRLPVISAAPAAGDQDVLRDWLRARLAELDASVS